MGGKSVFKRYKIFFYFTCCIIISLFLSGCQTASLFRPGYTSIDINEKEYLEATWELVMNKNFKAAARENQRILEYYKTSGTNHMISSNSLQNAEIISELLTRIMDDDNRKQVLFMKLASNEEQIELLTLSAGSFKKKAGALEKKLAAMEGLSRKVKILEKEKKMLQQQIDRLKEIDLNPNPVGSKPSAE